MVPAEAAVREWINENRALVPPHNDPHPDRWPLSRGAYLRSQRSPADGAYVVLATTYGAEAPVAEPSGDLQLTRLTFRVYAGTEEHAERAAAALATILAALAGLVPCGQSGTWILGHDQLTGPLFVPAGPDAGEQFCFQVTCQLLLADYATP